MLELNLILKQLKHEPNPKNIIHLTLKWLFYENMNYTLEVNFFLSLTQLQSSYESLRFSLGKWYNIS